MSSHNKAKFTTGSTMRHVINMTSAGTIGLLAVFFVDVLNLYYISRLGHQELAAAIGYASTLMYFSVSLSVGFSISTAALTARALGKGEAERAKSVAITSLVYTAIMSASIALVMYLFLEELVSLLGAKGETATITSKFMVIAIPSMPMLSLAISFAAILRAIGDAKRSMMVTLTAAITSMVLDPLLILWLDLGIEGAAIAVFITRLIMVSVGAMFTWRSHDMFARPHMSDVKALLGPYFAIAGPAILTQISTPFGNAWLTRIVSEFGDDAVAGWAIVGRLIPLSFSAIFALSGAVGPIIGQNYGALLPDRVSQVIRDSLIVITVYSLVVWALLASFSPWIAQFFNAKGQAADMVHFFCIYVAGSFIFAGMLFASNAAFNNLDRPLYSTAFNWGRATIGTIPFAMIGAEWGPNGVIAGWGIGAIIFGLASIITCFAVMRNLPATAEDHEDYPVVSIPSANSPFTSGKAATFAPDWTLDRSENESGNGHEKTDVRK